MYFNVNKTEKEKTSVRGEISWLYWRSMLTDEVGNPLYMCLFDLLGIT